MDEVVAERPHKSIKFTVNLWTNDLASDATKVRRGHAWYKGVIHVQANPVHGVHSQGDPIPFNSPAEFQEAFERAVGAVGVVLHEPGTGRILVGGSDAGDTA
jgi:hypothetical protein